MKKVYLFAASIFPAICCAFYFMNDAPSLAQKALWFFSRGLMIGAPFVYFVVFSQKLSMTDFLSQFSLKKFTARNWIESLLLALCMCAAIEIVFRLLPEHVLNFGLDHIRKKIAGLNVARPESFLIFALLLATVHAVLEEFYWRYFIFHAWIEETQNLSFSHILAALAFSLHHGLVVVYFFGMTWGLLFAPAVAIAAFIWQLQCRHQKSFIGLWLCHFLVDCELMSIGWRSIVI